MDETGSDASEWDELATAVGSITSEIVACRLPCEGVEHNDVDLPRGLYLELEGRSGAGAVLVGINPGRSGGAEAEYYRRHGPTAAAVEAWFHLAPGRYAYHRRLRSMATVLGFDGPLLWTELAMCQSLKDAGIPPLQTLRFCSGRFLLLALALVPGWPVIGTGWDAYTALGYLCPDRLVIGVPHASGSWSARIFEALLLNLHGSSLNLPAEPKAVWLPHLIAGGSS